MTSNPFAMNADVLDNATPAELDELLELTDDYSSEQDSPIYLYSPNAVISDFHSCSAYIRWILGGNRSGKSHGHTIDICCELTRRLPSSLEAVIPKSRLLGRKHTRLTCVDYPNGIEKIVLPYIDKWIPREDIHRIIKEQGRVRGYILKNGNTLELMSNDQDVRKHQGVKRTRVAYDEEPDKDIFDENLMRIIDEGGEISGSMTPTNGMSWTYDDIYLKAGSLYTIDGMRTNPEGDPGIAVFKAGIFDNKAIDRGMAERVLALYDEDERAMRSSGAFISFSGLVYKKFNDKSHLYRHELRWWDNEEYTLYEAIDPHPRTPHAVLFLVVNRAGTKYLVDELYMEGTTKELAIAIAVKRRGKVPALTIIDPIAHTPDPQTGMTFAMDLARYGISTVGASKDKTRGILRVKDALTPLGANKQPELLVAAKLKRTRFEFMHYCWDDYRKAMKIKHGAKQTPVKKDDHMMENLYRLFLCEPQWIDMNAVLHNDFETVMSDAGY